VSYKVHEGSSGELGVTQTGADGVTRIVWREGESVSALPREVQRQLYDRARRALCCSQRLFDVVMAMRVAACGDVQLALRAARIYRLIQEVGE
jgi:hypothetical protein